MLIKNNGRLNQSPPTQIQSKTVVRNEAPRASVDLRKQLAQPMIEFGCRLWHVRVAVSFEVYLHDVGGFGSMHLTTIN
jgi:hypothetical protein